MQYISLVGCRLPPLNGYLAVSSFNNRNLWNHKQYMMMVYCYDHRYHGIHIESMLMCLYLCLLIKFKMAFIFNRFNIS